MVCVYTPTGHGPEPSPGPSPSPRSPPCSPLLQGWPLPEATCIQPPPSVNATPARTRRAYLQLLHFVMFSFFSFFKFLFPHSFERQTKQLKIHIYLELRINGSPVKIMKPLGNYRDGRGAAAIPGAGRTEQRPWARARHPGPTVPTSAFPPCLAPAGAASSVRM